MGTPIGWFEYEKEYIVETNHSNAVIGSRSSFVLRKNRKYEDV